MYIATSKNENVVVGNGNTVDYLSNGYPRIVEIDTAFVPEFFNIVEVDSVPEDIKPHKYCHTDEKGFYQNPKWEEPNQYGISNTLLHKIQSDSMQQLQEEISGAESAAAMPVPEFVRAVRAMTLTADDQTAAKAVFLYPLWQPDKAVKTGDRLQYEGKLYKVIQNHTTQAGHEPSIHTAALYTVINVENTGTIDDPIPWETNMECYKGKYYTWNGVLYKCIRDSGIALAYSPDQLLGNYFEKA